MFPAAGDGCFYVGLGGKTKFPNPSYEPYQCCPNKPSRGTKVPKMSPAPNAKQVTSKNSRPNINKPFQTVRKDVKVPKAPLPKGVQLKAPAKSGSSVKDAKEKHTLAKPEKGKGKKGFFGTGKYIWWW